MVGRDNPKSDPHADLRVVYAISDERPRDGISAADMRFMQDVAAAVMEHLELAKDSDDRVKGERMVRGLQQFIERSSVADMRDEAAPRMSTMERQTENARLQTLEEDEASGTITPSTASKHAQRKPHAESDTARIFHRAARIMRQSTLADGVVFFDTSAAGIKGGLYDDGNSVGSSDESVTNNTTDFDTADSTATARRRRRQKAFTEDASEHRDTSAEADSKPCPVAGLSLRQGNAEVAHKDFAFTEAAMERYIHRYPFGKFFNYNEEGIGINSSDEKSERSETDQSDRTQTSPTDSRRRRKRRERFIPTEFLKVLPNVRTLIFLPLYDPSSERWVAGGFIWTTQAGRLMSPENELPYLQAFGNSITSEVARLSAQKADRAKTTFIASISHELRSPLHGILGSVEFLRDTVASAYQESLVSSIETCGKTLLDTIDHVLDHAKINKLRNTGARRRQRGNEGRTKRLPSDNSILGVTADFDLAQLVEEVCDTVCAGHTFRKAHGINAVATDVHTENVGVSGATGEDTSTAKNGTLVVGKDNRSVIVSLIVAPHVSWAVRSQPGALRRIVMNLIGNALKYTDSGFVALKLVQSGSTAQNINLSLTVEDSGRGMSPDFQKTKLFSPFSQEDPFASGTGLGLSIVKQIVESLKGEIHVRSTVQVGTQIQVTLQLPVGQSETTKHHHNLLHAPEALKGTDVSILCECDSIGGERGMKVKESMQNACRGFNMDILDIYDPNLSNKHVDFLLTDATSLDRLLQESSSNWVNDTPLTVVCVCTDTAEKTALEKRLGRQIEALGWTAEVLTQP